MSDTKKYTVIELAEVLNVPRTTVTDWLVRYSSYIDYKIQGKRKVYTDSSVSVLKEISELRNKGLSSFDIEEELAKRHPVHGEVSDKEQHEGEGLEPEESDSTSLVLRKSMTEMGETIKNTLLEMNRRIEEMEKVNAANAARANLWFAVVIILFFALVAAGCFFYLKIETSYTENQRILLDNRTYLNDLKTAQEQMNANKTAIREKENEILKLESGLEKQAKELRDSETSRATEMIDLKNKFAEEKLNLLKELENARQDREKLAQLQAAIQKQADDQEKQLKKAAEKPVEAEAVQEKPAEPQPEPKENPK
ncbi:MAG: hypothetical protein A2X45_18680 [Lentisphaerae bacterium GWF2_50_93]|nr:MAG: hypothetical protein A2X45_18680 [Lentisphaerae bacterium GWF2_50_93]